MVMLGAIVGIAIATAFAPLEVIKVLSQTL